MFEKPKKSDPLFQGDIIDSCPLIFWVCYQQDGEVIYKPKEVDVRVIVITQSCDLDSRKLIEVQVAVVHEAKSLVDQGDLTARTIRDNIRRHRHFGMYFLEQSKLLPESIVDFRDIHTVPRLLLDDLIARDQRICTLVTPYREHMAKHFADTFSRVALPAPPKTVD